MTDEEALVVQALRADADDWRRTAMRWQNDMQTSAVSAEALGKYRAMRELANDIEAGRIRLVRQPAMETN